jgi:hypothetical protein
MHWRDGVSAHNEQRRPAAVPINASLVYDSLRQLFLRGSSIAYPDLASALFDATLEFSYTLGL